MLKYHKFEFSPFAENTYLLWDDLTLEGMIIDPGCYYDLEQRELSGFIERFNIKVLFLINTHCHLDHIFGNNYLIKKYNPRHFAGKEDIPLLLNAPQQGSMFGVKLNEQTLPGEFLSEDIELELGGFKIQPLYTPGHSPGEFSLFVESLTACFTGDVLFKQGIGRTDLWGGNYTQLISSINKKLFVLPDETIILPGHGEKSTIGEEKINFKF